MPIIEFNQVESLIEPMSSGRDKSYYGGDEIIKMPIDEMSLLGLHSTARLKATMSFIGSKIIEQRKTEENNHF